MAGTRIETALERALSFSASAECPPRLRAAMVDAVFPGGGRVRPRLVLAVANACGGDDPALVDAALAAVELMHCASLVHDDLPCFDNAAWRRGRPTVHRAYGEQVAVLVGDALITNAFECLARAPTRNFQRLGPLLSALATGVGAPRGLVAGQAWEAETEVDLTAYHRAKTGALFEAAAAMGALAVGANPAPWRKVAAHLGEAYQVADDLADLLSTAQELGKPVGQDCQRDRPNAAAALGVHGAVARLDLLVNAAQAAVPECHGRAELQGFIEAVAERLLPTSLSGQTGSAVAAAG
jgi:geranylgeranyl diphosphate synthase type II